jgi:hypothetical protein
MTNNSGSRCFRPSLCLGQALGLIVVMTEQFPLMEA